MNAWQRVEPYSIPVPEVGQRLLVNATGEALGAKLFDFTATLRGWRHGPETASAAALAGAFSRSAPGAYWLVVPPRETWHALPERPLPVPTRGRLLALDAAEKRTYYRESEGYWCRPSLFLPAQHWRAQSLTRAWLFEGNPRFLLLPAPLVGAV